MVLVFRSPNNFKNKQRWLINNKHLQLIFMYNLIINFKTQNIQKNQKLQNSEKNIKTSK
jgi:hypothetical protein